MSTTCPTCQGTGQVQPAGPAAPRPHVAGGTCSCDGPPHAWSPGWCPASGPVTGRNRR